ncbi:hypothetical protein [Ornithinibacillus californiensis]|uniref:hypothetical protein n=1 Tax=Ornithinibacillus californiensis TaxID=161536 RepID=UPI00064E1041|nr:hypothetical protein [Ornithinibacillus californiensis]
MNLQEGFKLIMKQPVILIIPILLQVLISFGMGVMSLYGIGLYTFGNVQYGETSPDFHIQFTLPLFIPLITDIKQSLSFLPIYEGGSVVVTIVIGILYFAAISFAMAMYLGSMKKVLVPGSLENHSILRVGYRYFGRLFLYQLFTAILTFVSFFLLISTVIGGIVGFIVLLLYLLAPYIMVLEDKSLGESFRDTPKYWKRYIKRFIPLALGAVFSVLILSLLIQWVPNESIQYYVGLVSYTCIGSVFIAAFMNLLNTCIRGELGLEQEEEDHSPKWKKWAIVVSIVVLPLLGVQFANGKLVTALQIQSKTTLTEGVYYKASWSNASVGSAHTLTTYGFEEDDAFQLTMSLPEAGTGADTLIGEGEVTWVVEKDKITKRGHATFHDIEEVVETSSFIYRLSPVYTNGTLYYTSNTEDGYAHLTTTGQSDEPMGMDIFVMNGGNDVFVFQYKKRFDPQTVIQLSDDGKYFIPHFSPVNPDDFKYFWYSKEQITKDRILDLMKTKNITSLTISEDSEYRDYEILVAAFLQQTDGAFLAQLGEYYEQLGIQTNISNRTAEEWTEKLMGLYGDVDTATFLDFFNNQNAYDSYERKGWSNDSDRNEYQVIVPFPEGDITLLCVRDEEGKLVAVEIVLPE